jgi:hypothetical protein
MVNMFVRSHINVLFGGSGEALTTEGTVEHGENLVPRRARRENLSVIVS